MLAVSGGMDSLVMLDMLCCLADELGITEMKVAHFDHHLRPASAEEGDFAEKEAGRRGLACCRGGADIGALSGNLEDNARRARYAFFREVAGDMGRAKIVTAHHALDQAETVLLHLLRGSGTEGLAAISPAEGDLIRPLLCLSREEIEIYQKEAGIGFCRDESNFSLEFQRNRLRLELIPTLLKYNPKVISALCATAEICRADNEYLAEEAACLFPDLWHDQELRLNDQPLALRRRLLRLAFRQAGGGELSFAQTEAVLALKEGQRLALPGRIQASYRMGSYSFSSTPVRD
ncbi:MAG: tRNA lysidine(34) synthetase TilS [Clostridiales bacterium]|nr:tRNA lysidine(34) synthetase TilS [Clostridiales bacterium]